MLDRPTRRQVLAGGLATIFGLSVRELLAGTDEKPKTWPDGYKAAGAEKATADHVILLWMSGGMSHIDTWDPKPGRTTAGEFQPIKTSASDVVISEILPRTAEQMKHAALVRSVTSTEGDHDRAVYSVQTSYKMTPQIVHPTIGSVTAHELPRIGDLPSFISVNSRAHSAGYLGLDCEAYYVGSPGTPDPYVRLPEGVNDPRASRRLAALKEMNDKFETATPDPELRATNSSYAAARSFMASPALAAFDLQKETAATREAYGDTGFGKGCLLAKRLIDQGVRFVQVSHGGFDTHSNNFKSLRKLGETIDPAIASLLRDLADSGKLKRTMVVMLSEFGRTPQINYNAGRDHHPHVFSAMLAGGGVKGGIVVGSSDADGREPKDRPVKAGDLHATICKAIGVNPRKTVETPLGRPMRLVDEGEPVNELFSAAG